MAPVGCQKRSLKEKMNKSKQNNLKKHFKHEEVYMTSNRCVQQKNFGWLPSASQTQDAPDTNKSRKLFSKLYSRQ